MMKTTAGPSGYTRYNVAGDDLWLPTPDVQLLQQLDQQIFRSAGKDEGVLIAPQRPGLYRIFERQSPVWEIYFLLPAPPKRQERMVAELEAKTVNWAVIGNDALDGRDERRFQNTHRVLWDYVQREFEPLALAPLPDNYEILHRNSAGASNSATSSAMLPGEAR
jgi:hypothetical protein